MDLGQFIRDASIIIASWTAIYGINAWRREYRGRREMELAEDALTLIYEIRDAISRIRGPLAWSSEAADREKHQGETDAETRAKDTAYTTLKRIRDESELLSRFQAIRYRFEARFGDEAVGPFREIARVINEIRIAAQMYPRTAGAMALSRETAERYERIIWGVGDEDDLTEKVNDAIAKLEATCRPILVGHGPWYGSLVGLFRRV